MSRLKDNLIILLAVVCILLLVSNIQSCSNLFRQKSGREKEMASRLDAEEKLVRFTQEKQALEEQLKAKEEELTGEKAAHQIEKAAHQITKKALLQEQLVNRGLKEELTKSSAQLETQKVVADKPGKFKK